ncbi:MAG: SDR family oxidoreductase, partial [Firmicutes bacterium]|nr:SDR family oxidoreductase [Bacillota bacterium]
WGVVGGACEAAYSASKGALISMTKALAKELGPSGIRVNCIAPGLIKTKMIDIFDEETIADLVDNTPLERIGLPEDVANAAVFLASEKASFITGQTLVVDGGIAL